MGQDFLGILKNPPFDVEIKIALVMLFLNLHYSSWNG